MVRRSRPQGGELGQVSPLVGVVVVVVAAVSVGLVALGGVLVERAHARNAADAAALAAAAGTEADALAVAGENGAELLSVTRSGDEVEVLVRFGRATARARASTAHRIADASP